MGRVSLVKNCLINTISPAQMKDGQIGEIIEWEDMCANAVGLIVQRYDRALVVLGKQSGHCFPSGGTIDANKYPNCKIRLLENGEIIKIIDNK